MEFFSSFVLVIPFFLNLISKSQQVCNGQDLSTLKELHKQQISYPISSQVLIIIRKRNRDEFCTGTMISLRHVLTTAHCVSERSELIRRVNVQYTSVDGSTKMVEGKLPANIFERNYYELAIVETYFEFEVNLENVAHKKRWPSPTMHVNDFGSPLMCGYGSSNTATPLNVSSSSVSKQIKCLRFGESVQSCDRFEGIKCYENIIDRHPGFDTPSPGDQGAGLFYKRCECEDTSKKMLMGVFQYNRADHKGCGKEGVSVSFIFDKDVLDWMKGVVDRNIKSEHGPDSALQPQSHPFPSFHIGFTQSENRRVKRMVESITLGEPNTKQELKTTETGKTEEPALNSEVVTLNAEPELTDSPGVGMTPRSELKHSEIPGLNSVPETTLNLEPNLKHHSEVDSSLKPEVEQTLKTQAEANDITKVNLEPTTNTDTISMVPDPHAVPNLETTINLQHDLASNLNPEATKIPGLESTTETAVNPDLETPTLSGFNAEPSNIPDLEATLNVKSDQTFNQETPTISEMEPVEKTTNPESDQFTVTNLNHNEPETGATSKIEQDLRKSEMSESTALTEIKNEAISDINPEIKPTLNLKSPPAPDLGATLQPGPETPKTSEIKPAIELTLSPETEPPTIPGVGLTLKPEPIQILNSDPESTQTPLLDQIHQSEPTLKPEMDPTNELNLDTNSKSPTQMPMQKPDPEMALNSEPELQTISDLKPESEQTESPDITPKLESTLNPEIELPKISLPENPPESETKTPQVADINSGTELPDDPDLKATQKTEVKPTSNLESELPKIPEAEPSSSVIDTTLEQNVEPEPTSDSQQMLTPNPEPTIKPQYELNPNTIPEQTTSPSVEGSHPAQVDSTIPQATPDLHHIDKWTKPTSAWPTQPYPTRPWPTQPYPTRPWPTQPYPTRPWSTQPYPTRPWPTQPYPTRPWSTQPYPTRPWPTQPYPTRPWSTQPYPTRPWSTQPYPTRPWPTQPYPTRPWSTQPYPTRPWPTQPYPTRPWSTQPYPTRPWPPHEDFRPHHKPGCSHQYPTPPWPTNPYPTRPWPPNPYPTQPWPPNPYPTRPWPTQPYPTRPWPTNPYPTQPWPPNPYPTQPWPTQPYPTRPWPTHPYPTQPWPPNPYPTRPYPTRPWPTRPYSTRPWPTRPYPTRPWPYPPQAPWKNSYPRQPWSTPRHTWQKHPKRPGFSFGKSKNKHRHWHIHIANRRLEPDTDAHSTKASSIKPDNLIVDQQPSVQENQTLGTDSQPNEQSVIQNDPSEVETLATESSHYHQNNTQE